MANSRRWVADNSTESDISAKQPLLDKMPMTVISCAQLGITSSGNLFSSFSFYVPAGGGQITCKGIVALSI